MSSSFVPVEFLSTVIANNTNEDGSLKDPNLLRRMENPICQACHARYKEKYPGQPFKIKCSGIYDDRDYVEIKRDFEAQNPGEEIDLAEIMEIYDVDFWASRHIVLQNDQGDLMNYSSEGRPYQHEVLRCTATHKVDRMGRGLGKTTLGVIEELHKAMTNKKFEIMVICPAQSQSEKWFEEIKRQIENSPSLRGSLSSSKKQPYYTFKFQNGSSINIFTAGSKSGRGADIVRGQSPRRVRLDEQDYLVDKDYQAIMPLVRRYQNSEFHGSSTPTGLRQMYWQMCTLLPEYREFHYPITHKPGFNEDMRRQLIAEAKTMDRFLHEFMAEFGDPAMGLFKSIFIDASKKNYSYSDMTRRPTWRYYMGIDWNGKGTGTKIRVIGYNPDNQHRVVVEAVTVDEPGSTMVTSMNKIRELNRKWLCDDIFIDYGFGAAQDELIRLMGTKSDGSFSADKKLADVRVIDFGGTLKFNKLVSRRNPLNKYLPDPKEEEFERRTKPYMVDGTVQVLEGGLFEFSADDQILNEQMRAYRVKTYSTHGYPASFDAGEVGDHDLDALMLALLACEMKHGLFQTEQMIHRMISIGYANGFGIGGGGTNLRVTPDPVDRVSEKLSQAGIPTRVPAQPKDSGVQVVGRIGGGSPMMGASRPGYIAAAKSYRGNSRANSTSRTEMFRRGPAGRKGPYGR